jgi:hypothetical protein
LQGAGAAIVGASLHTPNHQTSGALAGLGAAITGTAVRSSTAPSHSTAGSLAGPGASVSGTSVHNVTHDTTGLLAGPGSTVFGAGQNGTIAPYVQTGGGGPDAADEHEQHLAASHAAAKRLYAKLKAPGPKDLPPEPPAAVAATPKPTKPKKPNAQTASGLVSVVTDKPIHIQFDPIQDQEEEEALIEELLLEMMMD